MNERIKQLANIWANRRAEDEKLGIVYTFSEPALEQFAKLIVKECLAQVDKVDAMLDDDKEKTGVAWVGLAIARHFGVEE